MTTSTISRAPGWQEQPSLPPADAGRRLITPAARALLDRAGVFDIPDDPGLPPLRLAEAAELSARDTSAGSSPPSAGPRGPESRDSEHLGTEPFGAWSSADAVVVGGEDADRVAAVAFACVRALREHRSAVRRAAVRLTGSTGWHRAVLEEPALLSIDGIARRIAEARAGSETTETGTEPVDIEIVDVTSTGAVRMLPRPVAGILIVAGSPRQRVVPTRGDGLGFTLRDVVEVWVHGGGDDSPALHATLLDAAVGAIGGQA